MKLDPTEKPYECKVCGTRYGWLQSHYSEECIAIQLRQALIENDKLKARLADWKDAWFEQREIIGRLAWSMPTLIPNSESKFFQRQWNKFIDTVNKYFPEKSLDKSVREITLRSYVDPFDNIEE